MKSDLKAIIKQEGSMKMDNESIKKKINSWIWYEENEPKSKYRDNPKEHDEFRKKYDLDCVLTDGNLKADTIFSLWIPLRFALVRINGYTKLNKYGKVEKRATFLKKIVNDEVMSTLLPKENSMVNNLVRLFELGQTRANIMILPIRKLNYLRGSKPYFDYIPYYLLECFEGGDFAYAFKNNDKQLHDWLNDEKLEMFFDGEVCKSNIKDLAESGDLKIGVPEDLDTLLINYIEILEKRAKSCN